MSIIELNPPQAIEAQNAPEMLHEVTINKWSMRRTIWVALGLSAILWALIIFAWFILRN